MDQAYQERRRRFMETMGDDAAALLMSPPSALRNGDAHFPYRQSSDLIYLLGCNEPEIALVLRPGAKERAVAFVRPRNKERETWDGKRLGVEGALSELGVDAAFPISELRKRLPKLLSGVEDLYYSLAEYQDADALFFDILNDMRRGGRRGIRPPKRIVDPRFSLHEQRLLKAPDELERLQKAADISAQAHCEAMQLARPGMMEYELSAHVDASFRKMGCLSSGYESIVGGGDNATTLHYVENRSQLSDGDLVLIDAGGEYDFYTADITRTFPVSGTFSEPQRALYQVVLRAQLEAIAMVKPGATLDAIHQRSVQVLTEGMVEVGLLVGPVEERIEDQSYRRFYMHRTSHWLGMDVHDVGEYTTEGKARLLEPGMVLTIEPGLYVAQGEDGAPEKFKGIGIRIEDDLVVTESGCHVLTHAVPKEINDVEEMCRSTLNLG